MSDRISSAKEYLQSVIQDFPNTALVLGTGLGGFDEHMSVHQRIAYKDIPGFPVSTVEGHAGELIIGEAGGHSIAAFRGRFHFYEGYSMEEVALPVRVMHSLGVKNVILSNASGGMNPSFKVGDIMLIKDHINLFPSNPLIGSNNDKLGPRFPDMSEPYHHKFQEVMLQQASSLGIDLKQGVYAGVSGPCYETPAEYKYLRIIGADAVGMSTVPETIAAIHAGMKVVALSVITDLGIEGHVEQITHEEVQHAAEQAEPKVAQLVSAFLSSLSS